MGVRGSLKKNLSGRSRINGDGNTPSRLLGPGDIAFLECNGPQRSKGTPLGTRLINGWRFNLKAAQNLYPPFLEVAHEVQTRKRFTHWVSRKRLNT
jgi:hypothetical protein